MAVGTQTGETQPPSSADRASAAVWNGTSWRVLKPVNPGTAASFYSVQCKSTSYCVATGDFDGGAAWWPLAEYWNGSGWHRMYMPSPPKSGVLDSVSCEGTATPARACEAVGNTTSEPFAMGWNGKEWVTQQLAEDGLYMEAVSCWSTGCEAAEQASGDEVLSQTWNGTSWVPGAYSIQCGTNKNCQAAKGLGFIQGIWCNPNSARHCIGVGMYDDSPSRETAVLTWSGGSTWHTVYSPSASGDELTAISCLSTGSPCWAVGLDTNEHSPGSTQTIAMRN
jgi:hypothetical protein